MGSQYHLHSFPYFLAPGVSQRDRETAARTDLQLATSAPGKGVVHTGWQLLTYIEPYSPEEGKGETKSKPDMRGFYTTLHEFSQFLSTCPYLLIGPKAKVTFSRRLWTLTPHGRFKGIIQTLRKIQPQRALPDMCAIKIPSFISSFIQR